MWSRIFEEILTICRVTKTKTIKKLFITFFAILPKSLPDFDEKRTYDSGPTKRHKKIVNFFRNAVKIVTRGLRIFIINLIDLSD